MAKEDEYKLKTKKVYMVQCPFEKKHVFEKVFELEEGVTTVSTESMVEVFCPFCGKLVEASVKGEPAKNTTILRRFEAQDKRLGKSSVG